MCVLLFITHSTCVTYFTWSVNSVSLLKTLTSDVIKCTFGKLNIQSEQQNPQILEEANVDMVQMLQFHPEMLGALRDTDETRPIKPGNWFTLVPRNIIDGVSLLLQQRAKELIFPWVCWENSSLNLVNEKGSHIRPSVPRGTIQHVLHFYFTVTWR